MGGRRRGGEGEVAAPVLSELAFQAEVVAFAKECGWELIFHHYDSRRSIGKGFPDLVMLRPPEILVVEVKRDKDRTKKVRRELQKAWLDAFEGCGIETRIVKPSTWDELQARLRQEPAKIEKVVYPFCKVGGCNRCTRPALCAHSCHGGGG